MTLTYRLYTNEFNNQFVNQLRNNCISSFHCLPESTKDILILEGDEKALEVLQGLMYENDPAVIKEVIPDFVTEEDLEKSLTQMSFECSRFLAMQMIDRMMKFQNTGMNYTNDYRYLAILRCYKTLVNDFNKNDD